MLDLVVEEENSTKLGVQVKGWNSVDWIDLAKDRVKYRAAVNGVIKQIKRKKKKYRNFRLIKAIISFTSRALLYGLTHFVHIQKSGPSKASRIYCFVIVKLLYDS